MKPKITWILIADGAHARVVVHAGVGKGLSDVKGLEFSQEPLKAQDIMADKQGRSFNSGGPGRAAMEIPTDPVDKREADFVADLARMLDEKLKKKAFDRLILVAAPKALGDLRKAISPQVKDMVMAEIDKDLTNTPNSELEKHFEDVLAV